MIRHDPPIRRWFRGPLGLRKFIFGSKLNILTVICAPLAAASEQNHWGEGPTFLLAMFAIAPLAERLGYLTEQLSLHVGDSVGALINASFGNCAETLISLVALDKASKALDDGNKTDAIFFLKLIQMSLLGSMLSNLLLVQGSAFFVGGLKHPLQTFQREGAIASSSLLVLATLAVAVPTLMWSSQDVSVPTDHQLGLSRFVAISLLLIYCCFLLFQLKTHRYLFEKATTLHQAALKFQNDEISPINNRSTSSLGVEMVEVLRRPAPLPPPLATSQTVMANQQSQTTTMSTTTIPPVVMNGGFVDIETTNPTTNNNITHNIIDDDTMSVGPPLGENPHPDMGFFPAVAWLILTSVAVGFISEIVVQAAQGAVHDLGLDALFVNAVVLPIVGNAAEHASALMFAYRDKMDISLGIAVGSAIQIPLFVMPVCVLVGWGNSIPLTLNLNPFMVNVILIVSLAIAFSLHAGTSHWLHGLVLLGMYVIIAGSFYYHDDDAS
jgi:Ca2+:H+ antiporter